MSSHRPRPARPRLGEAHAGSHRLRPARPRRRAASRRPTPALATAAAVLAAAAIAVGCGSDEPAQPTADDIPDGAVAVVADRPITRQQLADQVAALARAHRPAATPDRDQLRQQALATLIDTAWLEREAAERDIEIDTADLRARWRATARNQFDTPRALRRFLGRQTHADVLAQLRLQQLTDRIHAHIRANSDNPDKAIEDFQRQLHHDARQATACHPRHTTPTCQATTD